MGRGAAGRVTGSIAGIVLLFATSLLGETSCGRSAPNNNNAQVSQAVGAKGKTTDKGDFKVAYLPVNNPEYAELLKELQDEKALEQIAADLNATISLPYDVTITFAECGKVNAFYDPEKRQISMCF